MALIGKAASACNLGKRKPAIAQQYQIVFLTNHASPWQERSFHALSCMCTELVSIEG